MHVMVVDFASKLCGFRDFVAYTCGSCTVPHLFSLACVVASHMYCATLVFASLRCCVSHVVPTYAMCVPVEFVLLKASYCVLCRPSWGSTECSTKNRIPVSWSDLILVMLMLASPKMCSSVCLSFCCCLWLGYRCLSCCGTAKLCQAFIYHTRFVGELGGEPGKVWLCMMDQYIFWVRNDLHVYRVVGWFE